MREVLLLIDEITIKSNQKEKPDNERTLIYGTRIHYSLSFNFTMSIPI